MTKDEKNSLVAKGVKILRHQYFIRNACFRITYYSLSGGWKILEGVNFYRTVEGVKDAIEYLVKSSPDKYIIE